jgi:hypothetical protein
MEDARTYLESQVQGPSVQRLLNWLSESVLQLPTLRVTNSWHLLRLVLTSRTEGYSLVGAAHLAG